MHFLSRLQGPLAADALAIAAVAEVVRGCKTREARLMVAKSYALVLDLASERTAVLEVPRRSDPAEVRRIEDTRAGLEHCVLRLSDGAMATFAVLYLGDRVVGATNYADVGDPEVKLYLRRRDGALRRRPEVGWLASVLMQKPRVSQPVLALPNEREVPIQGRRALTAWLHALMDADPKPKRWHWVRVTLAAEERGRNESRAVALDEIEEIDRDLAAKSNIEPQALHRW